MRISAKVQRYMKIEARVGPGVIKQNAAER